jgi:hypothetical protein
MKNDPLLSLKMMTWYEKDIKEAKKIILKYVNESQLPVQYKSKIEQTLTEITNKGRLDLFTRDILPKFNRLGLVEDINRPEDYNEEFKKQVQEYAELSKKIVRIKAQLEEYKERETKLKEIITPILTELNETGKKSLVIENIIISISKKGYERATIGYKEAFEWLYDRVNPAMKKIIDEALAAKTKITNIAPTLKVDIMDDPEQLGEDQNTDMPTGIQIGEVPNAIALHNEELQDAIEEAPLV